MLHANAFGFQLNAPDRRAEFHFVINQLAECGDIASVGNGYWIPGPVRAIHLPASNDAFVVGGLPTPELEQLLNTHVASIGTARYVSADDINFPKGQLDQWLGDSEPLPLWTERTLRWAEQQFQSQAEIEDDSLEIYAPDIYRARKQIGFWMTANTFSESRPSIRLCRPKSGGKYKTDRPNYLGVFKLHSRGARLVQATQITRDMAIRLQFGMDQKYNTSREIQIEEADNAYGVDLKFRLPDPERRTLALSWRSFTGSRRFFPRVAFPGLEHAARRLGMRLVLL